jgi:hypothetical protein
VSGQYGDSAAGWTTEVRFAAGSGILFRHSVHVDFVADPAPCTGGTGGKKLRLKSDLSTPSTAKAKNT